MSKRKKPQPEPEDDTPETGQTLQRIKRDTSFGAPPTVRRPRGSTIVRMNDFLRKYAETAGNISATCRQTNISRETFYRWTKPSATLHIYKRFQARLARIKPIDVLLDAAEHTIAQRIAAGDLTASMFVINKLGHRRGWTERPDLLNQANAVTTDAAVGAVKAYQMWLADFPNATEAEKSEWLSRFARRGGIDESELLRTMKVQELTASVQ